MDMITGAAPLPARGGSSSQAQLQLPTPEKARTDVLGWLSNPALWQRVWESSDIETDRKDKKGDKRPLIRPSPGPDIIDRRGVFTVPDITAFTSVHVKELVRILLTDDSKRLALEGLKARSNTIGDAGLVELTSFLDNDPITNQPMFPNFKKLVLFQDLIVGTQQTMDWWKRDSFKIFMEALRFNSTLTWLDLSSAVIIFQFADLSIDNTLGGDSPKFLGAALTTNTTLRILKIDNARVTAEMSENVLFCMQRNHTLQYLSWFQCELVASGALKNCMNLLRNNISLGVAKFPLEYSTLKKHYVFETNMQITLFRDQKAEKGLAAVLDQNDEYQTKRISWAEQYLRTGKIDELASQLITAQGAMERSTQVLNLSDIRPLKGLPVNSLRNTVTSLILVRCGLTELPSDIGGFKALERLIVAFNSLTTFPAAIGQLKLLRELDAGHNKLTFDLPVDMSELSQLERLFLHQNDIAQFPNVLERIPSLRILDLQVNRIATIPDEFFESCNLLRHLYLSDNPLLYLPSTIQHCKQLIELALSRTSLEYLPVELHYIYKDKENMTQIALDGTPMAATLPATIAKNMDLFNHLRMLDEKSKFFPFVKLMFVGEGAVGKTTLLYLMDEERRRKLDKERVERQAEQLKSSSTPASPSSSPQSLSNSNRAASPASGSNTGTMTRDRAQTNLSRASSMWAMRSLSGGTARRLGVAAAAAAIASGSPVGSNSPPTLQSQASRLRLNEDRKIATDGIDIREVRIGAEKGSGKELVFRAWDFAGQEVYYATHQFFLSKSRAVYLVLFNAASVTSDNNVALPGNMAKGGWFTVEYWLQSLEARAGEPAVMLVGTHLDEIPEKTRDRSVEDIRVKATQLQKRYKFIEGLCLVSPDSKSSVQDLRKRLYELAFKRNMVGQPVSTSYMMLDEYIQKLNEARRGKNEPGYLSCMTWAEFRALAGTFQVPDDKIEEAASFLNEVGTLVYFEEEHAIPYVFLDPQWLADVMASVFSFKHNYGKVDGRLRRDQLIQLWKEPEYPRELHHVLLKLLCHFEIILPLPSEQAPAPGKGASVTADSNQVLLVPHWLSEERPNITLMWPEFDVTDTEYRRRFKMGFVPTGFFSRLMIRLLHFTKGTKFWRSGLLLEQNENRALVELNKSSQMLDVAVRGPSSSKLLRVVLETVEALMTNWFQIKTERMVPCTHCISQRNLQAEPTYFSIDECQMAIAESRDSVDCKGIKVTLERLIPDVSMRDIGGSLIDFKKDLAIDKPIGKGGFGIIYRATWRSNVVAVKMLMLDKDVPTEDKAKMYGDFRQEVWLMSGLIHPNVVSLLGYCTEPYAMVMDFVACGDLYGFLHDEKRSVEWPVRLKIALDIAKGMEFLHTLTPPLLHRDLKSPNILLDSTDPYAPVTAKVSDFGLSSLLFIQSFKEKSQDRAVANPTWLAPEVLNEEEYSEKSDVYAAGVMMHELLTRRHPYDEFTFKFMWELEDIIIAEKRPSMPVDTPLSFRRLIEDAWNPNPSLRPTFSTICKRLVDMSSELAPGFRLTDAVTLIKNAPPAATPTPTPAPAPSAPAPAPAPAPVPLKELPMPLSLPPPPVAPESAYVAAHAQRIKAATPPLVPAERSEPELSSYTSPASADMPPLTGAPPPVGGGFIAARPSRAAGKNSSFRMMMSDRSTSASNVLSFSAGRNSTDGSESSEGAGNGSMTLPSPVNARPQSESPVVPPAGVHRAAASLSGSGTGLPPVNPNRMITTSLPASALARASAGIATSLPRTAHAPTVSLLTNDQFSQVQGMSGRWLTTVRVDSPRVMCMAYIARQVWTGSGDGTVHCWSAHSGEWIMSIPRAHYAAVSALLLSGGNVWSSSLDKTLRCWTAEEARPNKDEKQKKAAVSRTATMNVLSAEDKKADSWKSRYVVLDNLKIQLFKKEKEKDTADPLFMMEVQGVGPREVAKHQFCFYLNVRGRTFVFEARSAAERDEWISTIENATTLGKKKKPLKTLIDPDKISALCAPTVDTIWTVTSSLQVVVRDARTGDTRAQRKLELQVLQANLPPVLAVIRPRSSPHVWIAVGHLVYRLNAETGGGVDQLPVTSPSNHISCMCDMNGTDMWIACADGSLAVWSVATGKVTKSGLRDPASKRPVTAMAVVEGKLWTMSDRLAIWDPRTSLLVSSVPSPHTEPATALLFLYDLKAVWCSSLDSTFSIWT